MEKKKLLLVAVSVGVFLVIVTGAAILVFNPGQTASGQTALASRSATADPSNMLNSEELRGLQDSGAASPIQENRIDPGGEQSEIAAKTTEPQTVISVSRPKTAAVPEASVSKPVKQPQVAPPPAVSTAPRAASKPAAVQPKPAPSAAPPRKTHKDFWVQAGSYSTRERADSVKENLEQKGITAIITNQQVNEQMFYRVRVGPYTSHGEADYWLAMIKSINGFENSAVWESQSKR
jgi:DedD protein